MDWLNVTWLLNGDARLLSNKFMAEEVMRWLNAWLNCSLSFEYAQGIHGFANSVRFYGLKDGEVQLVAIIGWGGANQKNRAYLELTGTACCVVKDWHLLHTTIAKLPDVKITRLDLAVDFFEGEYTPVQASEDFGQGKFQFSRRMAPKTTQAGDWDHHTGEGRTFYVGKRVNGKQARVYEKGKQLGCPRDPWTRFEVELHNRDREIPLEAILDTNTYFAGCFPICGELLGIEGEKILTYQEEFAITLDRLIAYAKLSYGKLFHVMRRIGYPVEEIFRLLQSEGVPARLAKSDWQSSTGRPDSPIPSGA
ncbi:MAG: replication initiation factor domain-containing protein [Bacillota bacterium]